MRILAALFALFAAFFATALSAQSDAEKKIAPLAPPPVAAPAPTPDNIWVLELSTGGRVTIQLRPDKAPLMVERIKLLTRQGFYNGLVFHRVIDGFMAQGGDPKGTGQGGSTLPDLKAEFNDMPHVRGTVSAARAESDDSANSQFFIMFMPTLRLDGKYTPFGRVLSGMQYVDLINRGEPPADPSRVLRAWIQSDGEPAPGALPSGPLAPVPAPAPTPTPTPAPAPAPSN